MREFEKALYEGMLVAFGRVLSKYNAFAQGAVLREVGKELTEYLGERGFAIDEHGDPGDLKRMIELFVANGFAREVELTETERGPDFVWHGLYGADAYRRLHEEIANPFLACPLNLCLQYVAGRNRIDVELLEKEFDLEHDVVRSRYALTPRTSDDAPAFDPLVIENARLLEIANDRADRLEKAMREIKTLRGILSICVNCKRVRDDRGEWQPIEVYVRDRSDANFSHGYCPDCAREVMSTLDETIATD